MTKRTGEKQKLLKASGLSCICLKQLLLLSKLSATTKIDDKTEAICIIS